MILINSYKHHNLSYAHHALRITLTIGIILIGLMPRFSFGQAQSALLDIGDYSKKENCQKLEPQVIDFRYSPTVWQSTIGLPDDPHKTVVASKGGLYYDFEPPDLSDDTIRYQGINGSALHFNTRVMAMLADANEYTPTHQELYHARIPIITTTQRNNGLLLRQQAWAKAPKSNDIEQWAPRRVDYLWLKMKNEDAETRKGQIKLKIASNKTLSWEKDHLFNKENPSEVLLSIDPSKAVIGKEEEHFVIYLPEKELAPGEEYQVLVTLYPGKFARPFNDDPRMYKHYADYRNKAQSINIKATRVSDAESEVNQAIAFWKTTPIPYSRISVPDHSLQRVLESSIRNIYQARERLEGRPVFQVGPSYYRGSWSVDGPFFMEAFSYLGLMEETRAALEHQADGDTGPGGIKFSKKPGLRLWMFWRHAQLTGDWDWLETIWPKVVRDVNLIKEYREMSRKDDNPVNDGLMPAGYADGGLGGVRQEYTNVYWTLTGLKYAIETAEKLNKPSEDWRAEYQDYWQVFNRARNRDKLIDTEGNIYVPPTMIGEDPAPPQRGAWAFMHSIYPGQIYTQDDALMQGTMDMLDDNQREGLIYGTGWLAHGIWNYAASFYAHAHLWLGHGKKAASTLYAFGNHASPMMTWREEQYPVGQMLGEQYFGDMPHNWASAEFIRLVRHLMIFERDDELHLLEGLPIAWTRPGDQTRLADVPTSFGDVSLLLDMAKDGQSARIIVTPPQRQVPEKIIVHLERFERPIWSVIIGGRYFGSSGNVEISTDKPTTIEVVFQHKAEHRYSHPGN